MERDVRLPRVAFLAAALVVLVAAGVGISFLLGSDSASLQVDEPTVEVVENRIELESEISKPSGTSRFRLWYTLTADGSEEPSFQSAVTTGAVSADEPVRVELSDPVNVLPQNYRLDLWLHERVRDEFVHAQQVAVYVDLSETDPSQLRTVAARDVEVASSSISIGAVSPSSLTGAVELRNLSDQPREVEVGVGVADAADPWVVGGEAPPTTWSARIAQSLPPLGAITVDVDELLAVPPGSGRVRLQVVEGNEALDDVLQAEAVEVAPSSERVVRSALPEGSLMITDVEATTEWVDATREAVQVTIQNLSTDAQQGVVEVTLAPTGADEPWAASRATCPSVRVDVPPREATTASLSCVLTSPVAELETSIWVFEGTEINEGDAPSDAVRATEPTTVVPDPAIEHRAERALGAALITAIGDPGDLEAGGPLTATITVENPGDETIEVRVWWILYDLTDEADAPPLAEGDPVELVLDPGQVAEVQVSGTAPDQAGTYQLSGAVHTRPDAGSDWIHGDQAWSPVPVRVVAP